MNWLSNPSLYRPSLRSRVKRGLGIGHGESYKGWQELRKKVGKKTFSVVPGIITNRRHVLRSPEAETLLFLFERLPGMVDIREYFPALNVDITLKICGSLAIEHEYREDDAEPFVLDFLLSREVDGEIVHSVKTMCSSKNPPTGRQLEIVNVQRLWCERSDLDWSAVDTSELTKEVNQALTFIRGWHRHRYNPIREPIERFTAAFDKYYQRGKRLEEVLAEISARSGESRDLVENHFRYAAWANFVRVDIRHTLGLNLPVVLIGNDRR